VINDRAGVLDFVLIGDAATRTVRSYRSEGLIFEKGPAADEVKHGEEVWRVTEEALVGSNGRALSRLPGHVGLLVRLEWLLRPRGRARAAGPRPLKAPRRTRLGRTRAT
jgi:hypothetical protein